MLSKSPIILSVLTHNSEEFTEKLAYATTATKSVHLDVIDNNFCEGKTLPIDAWPVITADYSEAHLMVNNPLEYLEPLAAKKVTRAIIHVEANFKLDELAQKARELDLLLGWAVNPDTDLDKLRPLYDTSSYIQVMGVHPGHSGQTMIDTTPPAVAYLKRIPSRRLTVTVDGGVSPETISGLKLAGANHFVVSHAVFDAPSRDAALQQLQDLLREPVSQ